MKQMKLFKWSVVLLALLLAAMVMVPMVSAENNYSNEKFSLVESNSIPADVAYNNAKTTMQNFVSSGSLDEKWDGATLDPKPLVIYDLNGAILAYQFTAKKNGVKIGEVNAAASKITGGPVLSIGSDPTSMDTKAIDLKIKEIVANNPEYVLTSKTIVGYNFPRLGVLALITNAKTGESKRIIIDANDLSVIPEKKVVNDGERGAWSFYDDISIDQMKEHVQQSVNPQKLSISPQYVSQKLLSVTRYDQTSENWCAVTVAQMISQYYGYSRTQQAIANKMGNGGGQGSTPAMELTYYTASTGSGGLGKTNSFDTYSPYTNWNNAADEIDANRPLKVGNLGHARTISGYKIQSGSYYLYVNDPAPGYGSYWILYSTYYNNYVYVK
ncbi:MAG: C39 family peptidase [Methanoregula sp.]|jgi:hypothetical protein|nr:C39 family peptidase [Methanoregula sp.]